MANKTPFEELSLPRKELPKLPGRYRVYKDVENYITVEAGNAAEAFKTSGLQKAHRIERDAIYLSNVLDLEALAKIHAAAAPAEPMAEVPAAQISVAEAPVAEETKPAAEEPAAAETTLSTSDVDKLLKGENATGA